MMTRLGLFCWVALCGYPLTLFAQKPVRYAVIVGVRDYDHPDLPKLKFTENDATELAKLLRQGGYVVELLSDAEGKKNKDYIPTKANIDAKLDATLNKCKRDDLVLVAFAGHGLQFEKLPDCFFCPKDAKPFLTQTKTLISLDDLYQKFKLCNAGAKVLMADCCRNDPEGGRGAKRSANDLLQQTPPRGIYTCFSCSQGETAFEHEDLGGIGHGVFFHHVLEGLRGKGHPAGEPIGFLTLMEKASLNVENTVREKIKKGAEQHPNLKFPDITGRLVLLDRAVADPKTATPVMIANPSPTPPAVPMPVKPAASPRLDITTRGAATAEVQLAQKQAAAALGVTTPLTINQGGASIEFVLIPPGEFIMGPRKVTISRPYFLSVSEVTQKQYAALAIAKPKPSFFQLAGGGKTPTELREITSTEDFPVENVSHGDISAAIDPLFQAARRATANPSAEVRLPTEAEWEFACRAGQLAEFHTGRSELGVTEANTLKTKLSRTEKVRQYPPNALGLFDMHGNVGEWCADEFVKMPGIRDVTDPLQKAEGFSLKPKFVVRGGSWQDDPADCSTSARGSGEPGDQRNNRTGFRIAIIFPAKDK